MNKEKEIQKLKEKNREAMSALGALGGKITSLRHGSDHYKRMAKLSWANRKKPVKKTVVEK
jgi:hypothetical protein